MCAWTPPVAVGTGRHVPGSSASKRLATIEPIPLETQAERRRQQLVRAAARLIELEGVEGVRMTRVAELAGCTRALVHQYFSRREDLLRAVVEDFTRVMEEKLRPAERFFADGASLATLDPEELAEWLSFVSEAAWDVIEDGGIAGLIMVAASHVGPPLADHLRALNQPMVGLWVRHASSPAASSDDAEMLMELAAGTAYRLALKRSANEITRAEAVERFKRYMTSLFEAFTQLT